MTDARVNELFQFQSTLPVWGGTVCAGDSGRSSGDFNPPSPCGEGPMISPSRALPSHFNPPSPCGEGPQMAFFRESMLVFQSTLPVWGGTFFLPFTYSFS